MNAELPTPLDNDHVELGEITGSLGFLLRMAQLKAFNYFYHTLEGHGLKPGEFTVIWVIGLNPGLRQGAVARCLHIKPAHMTKLIARLVEQGLVSRTIPDDDRRSVRLTLTAEGDAFVAGYRDKFLDLHITERSDLSAEEAATLLTLLRRYAGLDGDSPCP